MPYVHTKKEISEAGKGLKNGRSAGIDSITNELIKYRANDIHEQIAEIFNQMAITEELLSQIKTGFLTPLQKPGKKRGSPENLRPIVLLSVIRKILAIWLIKRCWSKLKSLIPPDQAAYQQGRSTTEHVFAIEQLAEKAIQSSNYKIYIFMLDMSKAFDSVNRKMLMNPLEQLLGRDEMHLLSNLLLKTSLQIKINNHPSEKIQTTTGITQGDCLSAVLFIFYLSSCLNNQEQTNTNNNTQNFLIELKYADDITWIRISKHEVECVKANIPNQLLKYNLQINTSKTEEFAIPNNNS